MRSRSAPRVRRAVGAKRNGLGACVLRREFDRQPLTTLLATAAEHLAPPARFHARAEPMLPNTTLVAGTIRRLTHSNSLRKAAEIEAKEREG